MVDRGRYMKRKRRANKKIKFIIMICAIAIVLIFGYYFLKPKSSKKAQSVIKIEEKIEDYGYELAENETDYYKSLFKNLKAVLSEKPIEEEKYASLVGQLFLADFFHLDNKLSKNDVGGLQFVYSDFRDDVEKYAKESVYHYVENNMYGDRKQALLVVTEVSVLKSEKVEISYLDTSDEEAYQIDFKIAYEEDMGYQTSATLYIVHHDNRLEIVKLTK